MFDSHSHYDDKKFDKDRFELLDGLFNNEGVTGIINAGCDIASSKAALEIAAKYDNMYSAAGVHPHEADSVSETYIDDIKHLLNDKKVCAIGEIGLDYHYDFSPRDIQKKVFREQMELASELDVPVIIHDREAHKDCVDTVLEFKNVNGVFHCFSGSTETAAILLKAGWYISFAGVVTYNNATKTVEAAKSIPDDRLLVETDCPYLAPVPFKNKRNTSALLRYTIATLAEIRGQSFEHVERITAENARQLFGI